MSLIGNLKEFEESNIGEIFNAFTANWHNIGPQKGLEDNNLQNFMHWNHYYNYSLWHEEDEARRIDVDDSIIAQVKRNIDGFNQNRNDMIQKMDEELIHSLTSLNFAIDSGNLNSETPGSMIDRISIVSLKIYHMSEIAEDSTEDDNVRNSCASKVETLKNQQSDLESCLKTLIQEIKDGHRHFKVYFQFKMYNDPNLNQAVRKNS
ncbi:MAG: hypothetical protein COA79_00500 [Planctomycetota bacterium]|nr:MAG: hypothetical protein COA79_00500 [Planctomycetota bacterium]